MNKKTNNAVFFFWFTLISSIQVSFIVSTVLNLRVDV